MFSEPTLTEVGNHVVTRRCCEGGAKLRLKNMVSCRHGKMRSGSTAHRCFAVSAGVLLGTTGIAKALSGLGSSKSLALVDPIAGIRFDHLLLVVGVVEVVIALVCLFSSRPSLRLGLVAWLGTIFVIYRLGLLWMNWQRPCSCLGNLTDALQISPQTADNIMKVVLAYLLIGSYGLLIWQWRQNRMTRSTNELQSAAQTGG